MPCLRQTSATGKPDSPSPNIPTIWLSVNFDFLIPHLQRNGSLYFQLVHRSWELTGGLPARFSMTTEKRLKGCKASGYRPLRTDEDVKRFILETHLQYLIYYPAEHYSLVNFLFSYRPKSSQCSLGSKPAARTSLLSAK